MNEATYFATARERYEIKLRRESGLPFPWTNDPIFREWRFCNVFREDDKTTVWFRENVRSKLQGFQLLVATVVFRWFNRIETGEKILDLLLGEWDSHEAERRLQHVNPIVTGAYMIRTPWGMNKLTGLLYCIDRAIPQLEQMFPTLCAGTLKNAWLTLKEIYGQGPFLSYEVVTDLRWTPLLNGASDILLWANAGPGCARGLGRVVNGNRRHFNQFKDQESMNGAMLRLLELSRQKFYWPFDRPWEMREVEHWSCEFEKYCAARDGKSLKRHFKVS